MSDQLLSEWELPNIPIFNPFPRLPMIEDHALETQVFTHTSYHQIKRRTTSFNIDSNAPTAPDNEKLEHVGDAVLGAQ
jgi:dsRNA-specific ribonuclease